MQLKACNVFELTAILLWIAESGLCGQYITVQASACQVA
jgi:hypothetical protein